MLQKMSIGLKLMTLETNPNIVKFARHNDLR